MTNLAHMALKHGNGLMAFILKGDGPIALKHGHGL